MKYMSNISEKNSLEVLETMKSMQMHLTRFLQDGWKTPKKRPGPVQTSDFSGQTARSAIIEWLFTHGAFSGPSRLSPTFFSSSVADHTQLVMD